MPGRTTTTPLCRNGGRGAYYAGKGPENRDVRRPRYQTGPAHGRRHR
jgi:hypothetical protein